MPQSRRKNGETYRKEAPEAGLEPATRCFSEQGAPISEPASEAKAKEQFPPAGTQASEKAPPKPSPKPSPRKRPP